MTSEPTGERKRWQRVAALFEEALERPAPERRAWVEARCDGDAGLAAEVVAMLAAHDGGGGILDRGPGPLASEALSEALSAAGPEAEGPEAAPERVGPYRVLREVGRGGMGVVYQAWDERLRRSLALKFLPRSVRADEASRQRFLDEARAASALEHPAICTVYDLGEADDGRPYIAMAFYEGRTLEDRLERSAEEGPVSVQEAVDWAAQVAGGLDRAHAAGIVHRDVKPSNLLLTAEGQVKILDFGVAKLEAGAGVTMTGTKLGTPAYMAPEQARGEAVDARSDVFSLGSVLYEVLAGQRTFRGEHPAAALQAVLYQDPPPLRTLRPEVPEALERLVARCLAKDPRDRPASAGAVRQELDAIRRGDGSSAAATPELPAALSRFVGREAEIAALVEATEAARLITLTGPGGTGKTRLAVEAARRMASSFPDGVRFVALDPVREPAGVAPALASALGVAETAARDLPEALREFLRLRCCLLVLDNFEQVVDAAPLLVELLGHCPELKLLVTSRILLRVSGERVFPVPPLELPGSGTGDPGELERHAATALFLDRARAADPRFAPAGRAAAAVVEICRRLDGLPLAIELAAARVRHFDPPGLLARLEQRLEVLGGGPRDLPARHRTLREAIAWSHDLLDEPDRALFRRLGVLVGGFSAEAAQAVAEATSGGPADLFDGLAVLLDHSLLQRDPDAGPDGGVRYRMLDTLQDFARDRLRESGEEEAVHRAATRFFMGLAERAEEHLTGADQVRWLDLLEGERGNLHAAMDRAEAAGDTQTALRLGAALWRLWLVRGYLRQGRNRLERMVAMEGAQDHPAPMARALHGLGTLLNNLGDNQASFRRLEESLELYRALDDPHGLATQLNNLSWVASEVSELDRARSLAEEAHRLHRELGDLRGEALALNNLGWLAIYESDYREGRRVLGRSLELRREIGDRRGEAFALSNLAWAEERMGRFDEAERRLRQAEALFAEVDDRMLPALTLSVRGLVCHDRGDLEAALRHLQHAAAIWRESGNISGLGLALGITGHVLVGLGRAEEAEAAALESEEIAGRITSPWVAAGARLARARAAAVRGEADPALSRARSALTTFRILGDRRGVADALALVAALAAHRGEVDLGGKLLGAARRLRDEVGAPPRPPSAEDPWPEGVEPGEGALRTGRDLPLDEAFLLAVGEAG